MEPGPSGGVGPAWAPPEAMRGPAAQGQGGSPFSLAQQGYEWQRLLRWARCLLARQFSSFSGCFWRHPPVVASQHSMGCGASKATADKTNDPPPERVKLHEDASAGKSTGPSPTKSAAAAADAVDAPPKSVVFIFGHDLSNKSSICKQLSDEFGCQYL